MGFWLMLTVLLCAGLFDPIEDQPFWHMNLSKVGDAQAQADNLLMTQQIPGYIGATNNPRRAPVHNPRSGRCSRRRWVPG